MRSEHRTTGDEFDIKRRHLYCRFTRAGVVKAIKQASHRHDRRVAKRAAIREQAD